MQRDREVERCTAFPLSLSFFYNNFQNSADLMGMLTILFLFALQVTSPAEMACLGSVRNLTVPMDLYIAGVELEGTSTMASQGQIVYLNGPGISLLKAGTVQRVIRPEGKVKDRSTGEHLGTYYRDIGTIRIEAVHEGSATAKVLLSCQAMLKGDQVIPESQRSAVEFADILSNALTAIPQNGLFGSVLMGKEDTQELSAGQFCFIDLGGRDSVKAGDRLTVFRPYPSFNPRDMATAGTGANLSYSSARDYAYRYKMNSLLRRRTLPPQILGDIIVVEAGDSVSTGKIINSLMEIHPGDLVVKR
jgi:hypothetical protein